MNWNKKKERKKIILYLTQTHAHIRIDLFLCVCAYIIEWNETKEFKPVYAAEIFHKQPNDSELKKKRRSEKKKKQTNTRHTNEKRANKPIWCV